MTACNLTTLDGTTLSRFCFGAMQFGGTADREASRAMYDACRAAGINFFDTANVYTDGLSETWLGEMVRQEREAVYVSSKVAARGGSGRQNILAQVEESRQRHGLETVDGLYLHRFDDATPLEETFETLAELVQAGQVRHVGVSNFAAWQVMKAQWTASRFGLEITLMQPMYNLVKRQVEVELLPCAQDLDIAVVPYSPLGGGLLTGKFARGGSGRIAENPMYAARYKSAWMHDVARELAGIGEEAGVSPATLAVAWVAANPAVAAPIISARSVEQLAPSLAAMDFALSPELRERITALSPTPAPATDRLEEV
ncbi:aryl-alcohol dehydrogenase-like predicted oxidoreductase [Aliiruegeria haliotis]|uniref:Aryl-alcohol dehydrogenase-like predicted oxidoreductase n=1 Tax=Aliiruegeria haliotis TaxID=1280846 RepID=A0A2T0RJT6_9RHOB|nr:aldo/keto reductase [Aliiruegeria haliotis]PRY21454.1 aryl-alcohol dehydrogenase-like predicted oxidoreductase [Aliiruegeria haliotis]